MPHRKYSLTQEECVLIHLLQSGEAWEGKLSDLSAEVSVRKTSLSPVLSIGKNQRKPPLWEFSTQKDPSNPGEGTTTIILTPAGRESAEKASKKKKALFAEGDAPVSFLQRSNIVQHYWEGRTGAPETAWPWGLDPSHARGLIAIAAVVTRFGTLPAYQRGEERVVFTRDDLWRMIPSVIQEVLFSEGDQGEKKLFQSQYEFYSKNGKSIRGLCSFVREVVLGEPVRSEREVNEWRSLLPYGTSSFFYPPALDWGVYAPGRKIESWRIRSDFPFLQDLRQASIKSKQEVVCVDFSNPILRSLADPLPRVIQKPHLFPRHWREFDLLYSPKPLSEASPQAGEVPAGVAPDPQAVAVALLEEVVRKLSEESAAGASRHELQAQLEELQKAYDGEIQRNAKLTADLELAAEESKELLAVRRERKELAEAVANLESRIRYLQDQLREASRANNKVVDAAVAEQLSRVMRGIPTKR